MVVQEVAVYVVGPSNNHQGPSTKESSEGRNNTPLKGVFLVYVRLFRDFRNSTIGSSVKQKFTQNVKATF